MNSRVAPSRALPVEASPEQTARIYSIADGYMLRPVPEHLRATPRKLTDLLTAFRYILGGV